MLLLWVERAVFKATDAQNKNMSELVGVSACLVSAVSPGHYRARNGLWATQTAAPIRRLLHLGFPRVHV